MFPKLAIALDTYTSHSPVTSFVVQGITRRGGTVFFTGKAGDGWVSAKAESAMAYPTIDMAEIRAKQHNRYIAMHGITFSVVPVRGLTAPYNPRRVTCAPSCSYRLGGPCNCGNSLRNTAPTKFGSPGNTIAMDAAMLAPAPKAARAPRINPHAHKLFASYVIGGIRYIHAGQFTVSFCISRKRPALFGPPTFLMNDLAWLDDTVIAVWGFVAGLGAIATVMAAI